MGNTILSKNISRRITCVDINSVVCQVHPHYDPVYIMTFILDGTKNVWVENDDGMFNIKIKDGDDEKTWTGLSQRDVVSVIEAQ